MNANKPTGTAVDMLAWCKREAARLELAEELGAVDMGPPQLWCHLMHWETRRGFCGYVAVPEDRPRRIYDTPGRKLCPDCTRINGGPW